MWYKMIIVVFLCMFYEFVIINEVFVKIKFYSFFYIYYKIFIFLNNN